MKPCISQATTLSGSFAEDVEAYAGGGCTAIEVWLTKLETHLEKHPAAETQRLLQDRQMKLVAAAYQGGLLVSQGEQRKAHFDHFRRRLELCQQFGIPTMLVIADFLAPPSGTDLERALVSLKQAAQWAAGFDVRLALEFRGDARFCNNLGTAAALVAQCDEPNVGLNFDVYHYYTGPSKFEDLAFLGRDNLFHVQLSDLAGLARELATDADRVMPGDGDFQLRPILDHLRRVGYDGWISLELFNPMIWQMKAATVAEIGMSALQSVLGTVPAPSDPDAVRE